ncbi:hypothetical protein QTH97_01775 [Variovorax sp. J22R24]|uniref:hypothetical protein n=1 Tax=Variovorax gracilis TaxID=3053502 RepID=UPI002574B35B|nr:hypothetical protein [Variovorax sp. J22R24]MDM0103644.1 hypothetical protein [Variovorax sp. J22R24]
MWQWPKADRQWLDREFLSVCQALFALDSVIAASHWGTCTARGYALAVMMAIIDDIHASSRAMLSKLYAGEMTYWAGRFGSA